MKTTLESLALPQAPVQAPTTPAAAERMQVLALVEQFEGMLLSEMLRDVRAGDEEDEEGFGLGASTMTDTMQGEFGLALSRAGGLGLGDTLAKALLRKAQTDAAVEAAVVPTAIAAPALGAPGVPTTQAPDDDHADHAHPTGDGPASVVAHERAGVVGLRLAERSVHRQGHLPQGRRSRGRLRHGSARV